MSWDTIPWLSADISQAKDAFEQRKRQDFNPETSIEILTCYLSQKASDWDEAIYNVLTSKHTEGYNNREALIKRFIDALKKSQNESNHDVALRVQKLLVSNKQDINNSAGFFTQRLRDEFLVLEAQLSRCLEMSSHDSLVLTSC